jgi:hypothetical protein
MLKDDLKAPHIPRRTHATNKTWGSLKSRLQRSPMSSKTARSVIGNWRIKTWPCPTTRMAVAQVPIQVPTQVFERILSIPR